MNPQTTPGRYSTHVTMWMSFLCVEDSEEANHKVAGPPPATARGYFSAFLLASVEVDAFSWNLRHVTMRSGVLTFLALAS